MEEPMEYKLKVCLIGEGAVGKTSLIRRFVHDEFDDKYIASVGMKTTKKTLRAIHPETGTPVEMSLLIWDIMGQSVFRKLLGESYFHGSDGFIAICDVTRLDTLYALQEWVRVAFKTTGEVPIIFLGNKCDLGDRQEIFSEDINAYASFLPNASVFLSSAKTGENVEMAFRTLCEYVLKSLID